ncbi:MAG: glycosyltransferase family 2 protein [Rhizomicrobium sp.]|jgi:glycosyltransferase involved in cell wall biosynthesis
MPSPRPFFSIVIPVFNRAGVFAMALQSVLDQTEQDFEIVIVDDGSRDDPKQVVDRFSDPRIRFMRQDNKGGGAARNAGIDLAQGRFIAFLDSDDWFLPTHLATMRRLLEGTHGVAGYARMIVDRGQGRTFLKPPRAIRADEHMATYLLCDRGFVPTTTLVVEAAVAKRVRYDETLPYAQDTDFAIRLFFAGCKFVMAEEPGAVWRDVYNPHRASAGRKGARLTAWLENLRPNIPAIAYRGGRGWLIAKGLVTTDAFGALKLYLGAVTRGCYRPGLAVIVFLQIFFSDRLYRWLADSVVAKYRGAVWSRADQSAAQPRAAGR